MISQNHFWLALALVPEVPPFPTAQVGIVLRPIAFQESKRPEEITTDDRLMGEIHVGGVLLLAC